MSDAESDRNGQDRLDLVAQRRSRFRRVLMAFDPAASDAAAVDAAALLATRLEAEFKALFVEDENVLNAVQYAVTGVFGTVSADRQAVDAVSVERALRIQTSRSRRIVEQVVSRQRLKASFEVRRGRVATEVLACGSDADLIVVGRGGRTARKGAPPGSVARAVLGACDRSVLLLSPRARMEGPVLVLYDGSQAAEAALLAAADIADGDGGRVAVALVAADAEDGKISDWQRSIARRLSARGLRSEFVRIAAEDREIFIDLAHRWGVSVAVLSADQGLIQGQGLDRLLAGLECSVLLVR